MNPDVQRYFDSAPPERKPLLEKLHALIMSLYPDAKVLLWYRMPTYRVKSGWVALAWHPSHVSLYTNGEGHLDEFKQKFPGFKTGKGCINFRDKDPFPVAALKQVIKHAIEHAKQP